MKIPPLLEDFPLYTTCDILSAHTSHLSLSSIIRTFSSSPSHNRTSLVSVFAAIRYPLRATPSFRRCVIRAGLQRLSCGVARRRSGWMVSAASSARLRPRACSSRSCASHFLTSEPAASHHFPPSLFSFFPPTPRRLIKMVFTMKHFLPASLLSLVIPAAHTAGAVDPAVVIVSEQIRWQYSQRLLRSMLF